MPGTTYARCVPSQQNDVHFIGNLLTVLPTICRKSDLVCLNSAQELCEHWRK